MEPADTVAVEVPEPEPAPVLQRMSVEVVPTGELELELRRTYWYSPVLGKRDGSVSRWGCILRERTGEEREERKGEMEEEAVRKTYAAPLTMSFVKR